MTLNRHTAARGAEMHEYRGYRFTVVTIANGAQPHTEEAELWWQRLTEKDGKWRYFRRHIAGGAAEAVECSGARA